VCWARDAIASFLKTHDDLAELKLEYNEAARPGTVQYDRFRQAWTAASNKGWRLVFHRTPARNVDSICKNGLNPKRRTGQTPQTYGKGEYFSFSWRFASTYCKGGEIKLIIFVVLCDETGVSYYGMTNEARTPGNGGHEIIVVHRPGTVQYDRFRQAWTAASNKGWRLVFHRTPARNVDSICKNGLNPKRRTGQTPQTYGKGEYFSFSWRFASTYCKGGEIKLIIFVVLCDETGVSYYGMTNEARTPGNGGHEIIVVHKSEHQLPLAVLTFLNPSIVRPWSSA